MARIASFSLLALLIAGCGSKSAPPPTAPLPESTAEKDAAKAEPTEKAQPEPEPPKPEPVTLTMAAPKLEVKLQKPGSGKKTPLKYVMAAGPAGGFDAEVKFDADVSMPAMGVANQKQSIAVKFGYTTEVLEVAQDGTYKMKLLLSSATASDPTNPANDAQMAKALEPFVGTTVESTMTASGHAGDRTFKTPPVIDPSMMQFVTMLPNLSIALPDKPLGKGATWSVTEPLGAPGLEATVTTNYKLVSRKGKTATIEGTQTITAGEQAQTQDLVVKELKGSGKVKATIEDGKLVGKHEQSQSLTISATSQGQDVTIVMNTQSVATAK